MMELKLTNEGLKQAISEAILSQIDGDARETLIREAIQNLLKPDRDQYGRETPNGTVLQQAFARGVRGLAEKVVADLIENDPKVREELVALVQRLVHDMLANPETSSALRKVMADAIDKAFEKVRWG